MNILYKLYEKFDRLEDNKRFVVFLGFGILLVLLMSSSNDNLSLLGVVISMLLVISRVFYFNRKKDE